MKRLPLFGLWLFLAALITGVLIGGHNKQPVRKPTIQWTTNHAGTFLMPSRPAALESATNEPFPKPTEGVTK